MNKQKKLENIKSALQELDIIIDRLKKHLSSNDINLKIPEIEIDLALEKMRKLYNELLFINNYNTDFGENIKNKIPIITETVTEKKQKIDQIKESINESDSAKEIVTVPEQKKESIIDVISKQTKTEDFASKLRQKPISDINDAIGLGEKLLFINELFDKNPAKYTDTVKELNSFIFLDEAMSYINSNFSWNIEKEVTINFLEIVKRKFHV